MMPSPLTREEEVRLSNRIVEELGAIREALRDTPVERMLGDGRTRRERTRGKDVERLGRAVLALVDASDGEPSYRVPARSAMRHWRRSLRLRWQLALSAQGVALHEARRHRRAASGDDLFQDAVLGLMQAASRYDPDEEVRFATYARWWVRAELGQALEQDRVVRLPSSATKALKQVRAALGDAGEAGAVEAANRLGMAPERARWLLAQRRAVSLQEPTEPGGALTRGDSLTDDRQPDPAAVAEHHEQRRLLWRGIEEALDERSRAILERRYGLGDSPRETLAAIAEDLRVSPQRVRQLQARAEQKLAEWFRAH